MNYGTMSLSGNTWAIACEPHVRAKLKRWLPEVSQRAGDIIRVSNNPENCRDLLCFIQRYPMTVKDKRALKSGADRHIEQESLIASLLEQRRPPEQFDLAVPAREYQKVAATLCDVRRGLLVADEVGLGKTATSILPMTKPENLPVLVVTLSHLPSQWVDEITKFAPSLKVHVLKSGKPYNLVPKKPKNFDPSTDEEPRLPDVIISNYHKLHGWSDTLGGLVRYVVFDEAHELRHTDSNKYAAARYIAERAQLRMGLSATPIFNLGGEIFNILDILLPTILGTPQEFQREWCSHDGKKIADTKTFGNYLRREGFMLRRTRQDVGRELPPVSKIAQSVECDPDVFDKVKGSAIELAKIILAAQQRHKYEKFQASRDFNILMRQATGVAKAPYVAEFVRLLLQSQEKVVLYGWHRDVYAIWMEALAEFKPVLYTGSESPDQKNASKDAFVNGDSRVIIISLRAGAGLDGLQEVCNTVVFGELDWSPGVHEQCVGRLWRDGVLGQVMAYYLISESGSDPEMASVLGVKLSQIQGIRDPDRDFLEDLEVDTGNVKRLAESCLAQFNIKHEDADALCLEVGEIS